MEDKKLISKKKPIYPISGLMRDYLRKHGRFQDIPVNYSDLLRFEGGIDIFDEQGRDTLWLSVYYSESDRAELNLSLKRMYSLLHADGSDSILPYINIDSVDYCTFGNTKPFRIKVRNILNDNYVFLYVKRADASRIYGLEIEHLLSPNHINFAVYEETLIEEHISGIPGDQFIIDHLPSFTIQQKRALAKEFVKFNEGCFIRLLADMRSYNYVVVLTHDFDRIQYRIRAIDFDQQSFEGNPKVYKPQYLKENLKLVQMTQEVLEQESVEQYAKEERSLLAKRAWNERLRLDELLGCMKSDEISTPEKIKELRSGLFDLTKDLKFKRSINMGELLDSALQFVIRNYKNENPFLR
jgi:hypothetical protein